MDYGTRSSTLDFINSLVSLAGIVLITSSPIKRVSAGSIVAKKGRECVYAGGVTGAQQQFDCCEVCGGPHYSSDCQTRNQLVYEPNPGKIIVFWRKFLELKCPPVVLKEPEWSDDYTEVTYDKDQCLSDHYTAPVTPPAYTPSLPFLATMEPADTLLMGDEVIGTIPARETDEFIKSSVDDLIPILRESAMKEEDFDINSPLGEQVVNFLMKNVDVAGLPRHLVKRLFSHLLKNPSLTKGMFAERLGDDTKLRSYDVTFSNPLFDFNDDSTLCYDNPLFDEEFEDISSMDLPKLTPIIDESTLLGNLEELERLLVDDHIPVPRVFDEPLSNSDSMPRSYETSDLFEKLIAEFGLDDSISTKIDDRYHDSEGDILYFKQLLDKDTSSDVSLALLPTKSSSLVPPLPDPKQICLREVERFDPFFSLTQSGGKTRVMETPSFNSHHIPSPRPAAYSPKEVMYCYYHPHLTSGDGFDHGPKMK
ncbi:hypothetical protein Tco_0285715 [Tanacetum coccineum]